MPAFVNIVWKKGGIYIVVTFQDFSMDSIVLRSTRMIYVIPMCKNESKMWNRIFSLEFSRKSNLKIFQTRVNLIQCPYERIIDKGLYYLSKICKKKNFSIFKALRSAKSNFWIWKLFDPLSDFNFLLRIQRIKNKKFIFNYNLSKWKIDQNLLSFEKFLKNELTNFIPHFRPTFTRKNHISLIQIPYLHDRTSPSSIKFHQFFKVRKFNTSSPSSSRENKILDQ